MSFVSLSTGQQDELTSLVRPPGWRILPARELPSVFPDSFRNKIDSALLIAQPTSTGGTYLGLSAHRVDIKDQGVDIEPFVVIVHSTGSGATGAFVHHGDWPDRTMRPPDTFWKAVAVSGIGDFFLSDPPEGRESGTLDQLPKGHRVAFDAAIRAVRACEDETK